MRKTLHELDKALSDHATARKAYTTAHEALHATLGRCAKALPGLAPGDATVSGHVGQFVKAANMHHEALKVADTAHDLLHHSVRKAITSIANRAGISMGYINPNTGGGSTGRDTGADLSNPGEITHEPLSRGVTSKDLQKVLGVLQSRMPRFGAGTRQRMNKNASGNPHFGLNR